MSDGLPPIRPVPHLERLLAPGEEILYTGKLHPFHGWPWLLAAVIVILLGLRMPLLLPVGLVLMMIYALAFHNFQVAVTTRRLLYRYGRFGVNTEGFLANKIEDWQVHQTFLQTILHAGTLRIQIEDNRNLRPIYIPWLWHPMTFVEALETLQLPVEPAPNG
jgi:hypothetical protein